MLDKFISYKNDIFIYLIILIVTIPIITVFLHLFSPSTEVWQHLVDNLLANYLINTFIILISVGIISILIGVSCSWLVVMYSFPGKNIFKWLLVTPIAIPTYVSAYIYAGLVEPSGLLFDLLENYFGLGKELYSIVDLRNIYGVIFILSICLYPYIYLLSYSSFKEQSYCALEVGQSLGLNKKQLFSRISIPLARPGIIAGLSLVMMETLAEFGTMDYYGVSTFATGIYRTWFSFGDETSALHLSSILLTFVFILIILEKYSRGKSQYIHSSQKNKSIKTERLSTKISITAFLWCSLICFLGIVVPLIQLIAWLMETYTHIFQNYYTTIIKNTIFIASISSVIIVSVSIYSAYINRSSNNILTKLSLKIFSLGYSIPGVVIAVGIIMSLTLIDLSLIHI